MPRFVATVTLAYDGVITPQDVQELLASTLEHCRQESMLSDPHDDEQSCDWIDVVRVEDVE